MVQVFFLCFLCFFVAILLVHLIYRIAKWPPARRRWGDEYWKV
jgi:hypothetical protein